MIAPHAPKLRVPGQGLRDRGGNSLYESAMHKTQTLDTEEVAMKQGEIAVLRDANHAWSNHSSKPARLSVCTHDGKE